jgi:proteasome lid subunit RPN8/RPN11
MTQALTTEAEEVMGLLLGTPRQTDQNAVAVHVSRLLPQRRVDRRKDRVETSPEQLAHAAELAATESARLGRPCKVVGWFHSHPHITVLPSHVDVATQARFQRFADAAWVGLIASVFNEDAGGSTGGSREQRVSVSAFQSRESGADAGGGGGDWAAAAQQRQQQQQQYAAATALEGLDEATRQAILEAAGGDLSAALAGTTLGAGGGWPSSGQPQAGRGPWVPRLVPLVVAGEEQDEEQQERSSSRNAAAATTTTTTRRSKDYAAIFRNLLEEERCAAAQRRRRGIGGEGDEAPAIGHQHPLAPGAEAARLLEAVRAGARHQRGVCALVSGALAPAVHLARLQQQAAAASGSALFGGLVAERELARRLRERVEKQRRQDEASKAAALAMAVAEH